MPLRPIFPHMNEQLGLEIWDCIVSMPNQQGILASLMPVLQQQGKKYPMMLWMVSDKSLEPLSESHINYNPHDPEFPGPFGALCKRYGKSYYNKKVEA